MSAQSRQDNIGQAGRPSILEGEVAGPTYGAADDRGGNRQATLPNGVRLRLQSPRTRQRVSGNSVDGTAADLVDGATGPGATNTSDGVRLGVEGQQHQ